MIRRLPFLFATLALMTACARVPLPGDGDATAALSVGEAKEYFEAGHTSLGVTKSDGSPASACWASPGDFTPMWDKAVESATGGTASVDVPIIPTYKYRAILSEFADGRAKAYSVDIYQKLLVVRKFRDDDASMGMYILTLIPDRDYAARNKGRVADRFANSGGKGGYSGLAVYSCGGIPMRMDKYAGGRKTGGISVFGETDAAARVKKLAIIFRETRGITILRSGALRTRSGEDAWWDFGSMDDYTHIGDNIYQGADGDYYIDSDGDGIIDSFYIMGDDPVMPDPGDGDSDGGWPPEDDGGSGNGNDDDHWRDDPLDGDDNNFDDEHDDWMPQDRDNAEKIPARLEKYYGKPEYYVKRVEDFHRRHKNEGAPAYYTQYGEKYCRRFTEDTKLRLSEAGKVWVDKTAVALQVKLSDILVKNPYIELTPDSLKHEAFESHVDAYLESGILSLPMEDKIKIVLTIDFDDLVIDKDGRKQTLTIIGEQLKDYLRRPKSLRKDADYVQNNYSDIWSRIREHASSVSTKSSGDPAQELYDLVFAPLIEYYEENVPGFSLPDVY